MSPAVRIGAGRGRVGVAIALFFLFLVSVTFSPSLASSGGLDSCIESLMIVYPDGSVLINETIQVKEAPANVTIHFISPPIYAYAVDYNGEPLPLDYNSSTAVVTVYDNGSFTLSYYTLNLTSKNGDVWTLSFTPECPVYVLLPSNAVPISINPTPTPTIVMNETALLFPAGAGITLNYYLLPGQFLTTPPPGSSETSETSASPPTGESRLGLYAGIALIIIAIAVIIYIIMRRRGNRVSEQLPPTSRVEAGTLDDRDERILEALRKRPMTAPELMNETGIPKTPLYRRLKKLVEEGYIEYSEENGVRIYRLKEDQGEDKNR